VAGIGAIAFTALSVSGLGAAAHGAASGVHNADQAGPDEFSQFGWERTAPGLSVPGQALAAAQAQAAQLPQAARLNPDGKTLLAATHGRGLWTFAIS
jgi:hypothetical protein